MALIRQPNNCTTAIGKIWDMMQMNAPNEAMIEAVKQWGEDCDPYTKIFMDYYLEIEKQRMQFFKMADPIFEGVVHPNDSNHANSIENVDVYVLDDDFALQGVQLHEEPASEGQGHVLPVNNKLRGSIKSLSFELVAPKFVLPIEKAACELNVRETTLSLWCRISGISYWPYRKLDSIDMLIRSIQEIGSVEHDGDNGVENAIKMLEAEKKAVMDNLALALKDDTLVMRKRMQRLASIRRIKRKKCEE